MVGSLTWEQEDAIGYVFGIRQYSNGVFLHYLTQEKGVADRVILEAMYNSFPNTPQEYLYNSVGAENFRQYFTDWDGHNTADFDYFRDDQLEFSRQNYQSFADYLLPGHEKPYAIELQDNNATGTHSPDELYRPRSWGYNVVKISNTRSANYTFQEVMMNNDVNGTVSLPVLASDPEVYLVVAAVPEVFTDNQTFDYSVDILVN